MFDLQLPYNFHDAGITDISVGPRRELTLHVDLDEPDNQSGRSVCIRFGGITNFAEVEAYIKKIPSPRFADAYRARIEMLEYDPQEHSKQNNLIFLLTLEYLGPIRVHCRNVNSDSVSINKPS